ncbi:unnamed protein product [Cuscuta campestris]|uniref:Uncharacterized protein n=1 Tax=Cuscuta campestris TaxID=132261 RepID=A0A484MGU0_9ASTE|nr:unnamed protein product [Cuscuta campestris]
MVQTSYCGSSPSLFVASQPGPPSPSPTVNRSSPRADYFPVVISFLDGFFSRIPITSSHLLIYHITPARNQFLLRKSQWFPGFNPQITADSIRIRDEFGPYLAASDTLSFYRNEWKSGLKFIFPVSFTREGSHGKL